MKEGWAEGGQSVCGGGGAWMVDVMLKLCLQSTGVVAFLRRKNKQNPRKLKLAWLARAQNVATAFRKLLQSRRDGVPSGDVERALLALEGAALRTINVFAG